jgi:cell shape-determining protein MreC
MSYLLDKKVKKNRIYRYSIFIFLLIIFIYFKAGVFKGLAYVSAGVFRPVLVLGNDIGKTLSNTSSYLYSQKSLFIENENLKSELSGEEAKVANYDAVLDENLKMKEILGRQNNTQMILGNILAKPNQSAYDTIILDIGSKNGVVLGDKVFAFGNLPIGRISEVYSNSSQVILFSSPGEKTEGIISGKGIFMQIIGQGGGDFEMILPRDLILDKDTEVVLPGATPYLLGTVETIVSDPRDSFQKALLISPVNIQELNFVEVEK